MPARVEGLYAITPDALPTETLLEQVREALVGGARAVQFRSVETDLPRLLWQASALRSLTRAHGVPLIIEQSIELALKVDADGVHLGRKDDDLMEAHARLPGRVLGVSCRGDVQQALAAARAGADYVSFGAMYPSPTLPHALPVGLDVLRAARRVLALPIVAIGGITPANAAPLIAAGADAIASVSALFESGPVRKTALAFCQLFEERPA